MKLCTAVIYAFIRKILYAILRSVVTTENITCSDFIPICTWCYPSSTPTLVDTCCNDITPWISFPGPVGILGLRIFTCQSCHLWQLARCLKSHRDTEQSWRLWLAFVILSDVYSTMTVYRIYFQNNFVSRFTSIYVCLMS